MRTLTGAIVAAAMLVVWSAAAGALTELPAETRSYYVEFRVAVNGAYGHSYIAYGRLNEAGQPASTHYVDLHPTGRLPSIVIGHVVPVHASTRPDRATRRQKVASRYRRVLTEPEYQQLTAVIERARASRRSWSIVHYNCNDFVAEVARGIGLRTPNTLALPYDFIPELQALNEPAATPAVAAERAPSPAAEAEVPPPPAAPTLRTAAAATATPRVSGIPQSMRPFIRKITSTRPVPPAPIPNLRQSALSAVR